MAQVREVSGVKHLVGRLEHGADLIEELTSVCMANGVGLGWVHALGALQKARIGYYNQGSREYEFIEMDRHLEITNLVGNVSLKDGEPIIHAHVTLADDEARAFGGHLAPGTIVFACEFCIQVFDGPDLCRGFDDATGLPLWQM
jgi:predicted DNA-binding protein with PD1-like motif